RVDRPAQVVRHHRSELVAQTPDLPVRANERVLPPAQRISKERKGSGGGARQILVGLRLRAHLRAPPAPLPAGATRQTAQRKKPQRRATRQQRSRQRQAQRMACRIRRTIKHPRHSPRYPRASRRATPLRPNQRSTSATEYAATVSTVVNARISPA